MPACVVVDGALGSPLEPNWMYTVSSFGSNQFNHVQCNGMLNLLYQWLHMLSIVDLPQFADFVEELMTIGSNRKRKTKVGHVEHRSPPSKCRSPAFQTPRWTKFPLGKLVSSRGKMSSGRWQMDIHLHRILVDLNILNGLEPSMRRYSGMGLSDKYHIFWFYYILLFEFIFRLLSAIAISGEGPGLLILRFVDAMQKLSMRLHIVYE